MEPTKIARSLRLTSARSRRSTAIGGASVAAARDLAIGTDGPSCYANRPVFARRHRQIHLCRTENFVVKIRRILVSMSPSVRQNGGRHMPYPRGLVAGLLVSLAMAPVGAAGPETRLTDAARAGDRKAVAALLSAGAAVNAPEPDGTTALHWAVYRDDAAMTERLVSAGANVNAANRNGATPLSQACTNAGPSIMEQLLNAGADPNAFASGAPPLVACAGSGGEVKVRMLLSWGADVNASDNWRRQTALMWAAAENHAGLVKLLMEAGANVDARSGGDFTALMFAVRQDARDAARLLIDAGADVTYIAPSTQTALRLAINNRHYTLASALLDAGAPVYTEHRQGN